MIKVFVCSVEHVEMKQRWVYYRIRSQVNNLGPLSHELLISLRIVFIWITHLDLLLLPDNGLSTTVITSNQYHVHINLDALAASCFLLIWVTYQCLEQRQFIPIIITLVKHTITNFAELSLISFQIFSYEISSAKLLDVCIISKFFVLISSTPQRTMHPLNKYI